MDLIDLGWNDFFQAHFDQYSESSLIPARVSTEHKEIYRVICEFGELNAQVSGRFRFSADLRSDYPSVGDWVAISKQDDNNAIIHHLLPRKSSFSRKAVLAGGPKEGLGKTDEQVLSANIDTIFIVVGLDSDFSVRRIERYVSIAWDSGAIPVVILNKTDLCENVPEHIGQIMASVNDVSIHALSAANNDGFEDISKYLIKGKTIAFLGSSGVGKSTIINVLLGTEKLRTREVREYDGKGRHTTTHRELIILPEGGIVIDTPGMREIQAWEDEKGIEKTFADIEALIPNCRFSDCKHQSEPGCAIKKAIDEGELDPERFKGYLKLKREIRILNVRKDQRARAGLDNRWKKITIAQRKKEKFLKKMNRRKR